MKTKEIFEKLLPALIIMPLFLITACGQDLARLTGSSGTSTDTTATADATSGPDYDYGTEGLDGGQDNEGYDEVYGDTGEDGDHSSIDANDETVFTEGNVPEYARN